MMLRLPRQLTLLAVLFGLVLPAKALANLKVWEADKGSLCVVYEPGEIQRQQISTPDGVMEVLGFSRCGTSGQPGAPILPVRVALVGVPPQGEVALQITDAPFAEQGGYHLAPNPTLTLQQYGTEFFHTQVYAKDPEEYGRDQMSPEVPVRLEAPSYVRDQRIVRLCFYPVSYNPVSGRVRLYERIAAILTFPGAHVQEGSAKQAAWAPNQQEEALYRDVVLNYEQARPWRKGRATQRPAIEQSPFAAGTWAKIKVESDGIYRIVASDLEEEGVGVVGVESASLRMFYGGGLELCTRLEVPRPELREIAIVVEDGGDGIFDSGDHLLFYGNNVSRWECMDSQAYGHLNSFTRRYPWAPPSDGRGFVHLLNHYTWENCYWLTWTPGATGKRMEALDGTPGSSGLHVPSAFRARIHEEAERFIDKREEDSGLVWYWDTLESNTRRFPSLIHSPLAGDSTTVRVAFTFGRSDTFEVSLGGVLIDTVRAPMGYLRIFVELKCQVPLADGIVYLQLRPLGSGRARFDWYEIEYSRRFEAEGGKLVFDFQPELGPVDFEISGFDGPDNLVFRVTDPFSVQQITGAMYQDDRLVFCSGEVSGQPERYYVLSEAQLKTPSDIELDTPANLRSLDNGADILLITHSDFHEAAHQMAQWRRESPSTASLVTQVVDVQEVYDEFAWGLFDPVAIRDFIKYAYDHWSPRPMHVLLLGDGNYDMKTHSAASPRTWIPPYENDEVAIDDRFVCISGDDTVPDLSIGRIAVQSSEDALAVVQKIIDYEREPARGVWQNTVLLVADDEVSSVLDTELIHTQDTEALEANYIPEGFNRTKVYLMEYEKEGQFKPKARDEFVRRFNTGALLVNYLGHGNTDVMAHEHVFVASRDMSSIANGSRLPLMFLGTCSASQFDHPRYDTLTESMMRYREGGTVATIGPTRKGYAFPNGELNKLLYESLFAHEHETEAIGTALWKAKLRSSKPTNSAKYVLLGDPAQRLAAPRLEVSLAPVDSIRALDVLNITGQVQNSDGEPAGLDGQANVRIYDSVTTVTHITVPRIPIRYTLPGKLVFHGLVDVEGGELDASALIPKDISYNERQGRVSVFVWNDEADGSGSISGIYVGGTSEAGSTDERGPTIRIGFGGQETLSDGDFVDTTPVLLATLEDESGINVTGEIGHKIELRIDRDRNQVYDVTDYFISLNGYQKGVVEYPMGALTPGQHSICLKAWDTFNNSAIDSVQVNVPAQRHFSVEEALCYPNPMKTHTTFTYQLSHPAVVTIEIYGLSGRLIEKLKGDGETGFNCNLTWWADNALSNGVYLYRVSARRADGEQAEVIESLVVMK